MPKTGPLPAERLRDDLARFLRERRYDRGVRFYTGPEWHRRGETLCADAPLTAVIEESPLFNLLNTHWEDFPGNADQALRDFDDFLESRGYYCELGFTWSAHFYPLDA